METLGSVCAATRCVAAPPGGAAVQILQSLYKRDNLTIRT